MQFFSQYKKYLMIIPALALLTFFIVLYFKEENLNKSNIEIDKEEISIISTTTSKKNNSFYIDIKGAVKKPGVYEVQEGMKVIDAINKAGGLTKKAVTNNINLSQKLKSEMVIYIFTKSELTTKNTITTTACKCETIEINNCLDKDTLIDSSDNVKSDSSKININTAGLEELVTLSGIGEAKAKAIIKYREENGYFESIEDIKNVSGLGEALFVKIKDNITI